MQSNWPEQLFILSNEALESLSWDEMYATAVSMKEMGLWKAPFDCFAVIVNGKHIVNATDAFKDYGWDKDRSDKEVKSYHYRIHFLEPNDDDEGHFCKIFTDIHDGRGFVDNTEVLGKVDGFTEMVGGVYQSLLVLLATKNIAKSTIEKKSTKLGIGKRKAFRWTTTLSIGRITENADGSPLAEGSPRRPHLRRGHIRNQHYGPSNALIKRVWIAPVFVNADKEWAGARDHYNVKIAS